MILVLADDLTGAAEVGGIAWRCGLTAQVQTVPGPAPGTALTALDTDTRSRPEQEAVRRTAHLAGQCSAGHAFKKVDSVLRGHVLAELAMLLETWHKPRALLVPANPALGRTIAGGQYRIDGQLLHETDFGSDPAYPATTAHVKPLLLARSNPGTADRWPVYLRRPGEVLPDRGIVVGEAERSADLAHWAGRLDTDTVPAGAAEFLGAFLESLGFEAHAIPQAQGNPRAQSGEPDARQGQAKEAVQNKSRPALFVCGSAAAASRAFCERCRAHDIPVVRLPDGLFTSQHVPSQAVRAWSDDVLCALKRYARAVMAIDRPPSPEPAIGEVLSDRLSRAVERVLARCPVEQVLVEGGATAAALVRRLGWTRMRVCRELAPGVVRVQVEGRPRPRPRLTMKPGSYPWPDRVWNEICSEDVGNQVFSDLEEIYAISQRDR